MDPIESVSRFERSLLRVLEHRGPRAFVWVVTLLSIVMSQIVTYITLVLTAAPPVDIVIGAGVAFVVPLVVASATAGMLARVLTSLRVATDQLHHLSRTDSLTGLLNRRAFFTDAEAMLAASQKPVLVVAMIDIDNFKRFNDGHGHAPGDQLLCMLAEKLRAAVGDAGVVGRLGGDEFGIMVLAADEAAAAAVAGRLRTACDLRAVEPDQVASVGVFVGCAATVRDDALEGALDDALAAADRALYDGKRRRGVLPFDDVRREPVPTFRSADEVPRPR